jgi:hypothetical protein
MNSRLIVNRDNELVEASEAPATAFSPAVKAFAHFFSYLFHPVFIPLYTMAFLLFIHPSMFTGFPVQKKVLIFIQAFLPYFFFPVVVLLLLKALKFVNSIQLRTQKDRIIPLIACMTFYFWIWYVWKNLPERPPVALVVFGLSVFVSSIFALMANIRMKISLHAISIGVMLGFLGYLALTSDISFTVYMMAGLLIGGITCTSRLIVSDHSATEVYLGLVAGILSVLIAVFFTV